MPRKKKTRNKEKNALLKQTKIIKSRLMELNLKLDDYIYKNKPISVSTAELHIQEVSSYSAICCRDERSLQVIEKISRCMKGIIAEAHQQDHRGIYHSIEDERQDREYMTAPSPVYSMPDDDVQLSQGREIDELNDNDMQVEDIVDLCSGCDVDGFENNKSGVDQDNIVANIQGNISKLFIGSTEETAPNGVNFSQNIYDDRSPQGHINDASKELSQILLLNFNNSTVMDITPNMSVKTDSNYLKTTSNPSIHQTATDTFEDNKMGAITYETKAQITKHHADDTKLSKTVSTNKKLENSSNINPYQHSVSTRKHTAIRTAKEYAINESCVLKDEAFNIPKVVHKSDTILVCKENFIPKKTKGRASKTKYGTVNKAGSTTTNKPTRKAPRTLKNKTFPKIYSEDTVNDLSWIENIRYVREVAKEENYTNMSSLQDDFWDNYSLPHMWNDREFD